MRRHVPLIGVIFFALALGGCGREKETVIARVNQHPITQRQVWRALEMQDNGDAGRMALDRLIVQELARQEARKRGIEVTREEIQRRIEGQKDYRLAYTGEDFETWLEGAGQTEDDLASRLSLQILTAKIVLDEDDRKRYFEENSDRLSELPHNNESVIFRQIVLATKEEAEAVYRELISEDAGATADFAEIAKARSIDPLTRARGGMVGWLLKGKSEDQELEKVLFSLGEGEIGEPVPMVLPAAPEVDEESGEQQPASQQQPPQWWRIVKVERYIPPHEITYEDNEDVIEDWMLSEPQRQLELHEFYSSLRARADISILSPHYRSLEEIYQMQRDARDRQLAAPAIPVPVSPGGSLDAPTPAEPEAGAAPADR